MTELSVEQAARHIGVSDTAVYKMIRRGELSPLGTDPVRLALADVQVFHRARRADALRALERRRQTPVMLADEVLHRLHPRHLPSTGLPGEAERSTEFRLSVQSEPARLLFGTAALRAAASMTGRCKWCLAAELAVDGAWAPEYGEAFARLLGDPCAACWPGLVRPLMERMAAEVHRGGKRSSAGPVRPSGEEQRLAREWVAERAVSASSTPVARPVGDDGGKSLVARNLKVARTRLKEAKRRGDTAYVARLTAQLASLVADAARVDGRAVTASARPGRLACGHLLAERCGCPRKASR